MTCRLYRCAIISRIEVFLMRIGISPPQIRENLLCEIKECRIFAV